MKKEEMRELKESMYKQWEEVFGLKVDEHLTEEGLKKFWSEETSVLEATDMLTAAAILSLDPRDILGMLLDNKCPAYIKKVASNMISGIVINDSDGELEKVLDAVFGVNEEPQTEVTYDVGHGQEIIASGLATPAEAEDEAVKYCLREGVKRSDVHIVCNIIK